MESNGSAAIDAFLSAVPEDARGALQRLRATIAAAAPDAIEGISYGVPGFKYRGRPLVSFGAAKGHCALYVQSPAVMDAHKDELAGYDTSKGTVRFPAATPLPDDLVIKLVRARMSETDAAAKK